MTGGYACAVLVNQSGWPFFAGLPLAFVASALIGAVLERSLYRHLYNRSHLDQVLFSVGLVFMSVAAVDYIMGSSRVFIKLPAALEGQFDLFGVGIGRYRLMIILICGLLTSALQLVLAGTPVGEPLRGALSVAMTAQTDVGHHARHHARWHWSEIAFWILALCCTFLFPSRYLIMTDIVRLALFALSLDLILGYAGIVSLGHAAFFGVGAYSAGLLALHGIVTEPVIALIVAGLVPTSLRFLPSFLVIRCADLTRFMVT